MKIIKNISKSLLFVFVIILGLTLAAAVNAWSNPAGVAGTGGGAVYYNVGYVGIGTTNPAYALDVTGDINFTGTLRQNGTQYGSATIVAGNVAAGIFGSNTGYGSYGFYKDASTPILYVDAANSRLGVGTASPGYKLDVAGNIRAGTAGGAVLTLGGSAASNSWSSIALTGSNSVTNWLIDQNNIVSGAFEIIPSTAVGGSTFTTPAFLISSTGNVGIGTTAPGAALSVTSAAGKVLQLVSRDNTTGGVNQIEWTANNGTVLADMWSTGSSASPLRIKSASTIQFHTNNVAYDGSAPQMTIDASGNVGIGTATPGAKLSVGTDGSSAYTVYILDNPIRTYGLAAWGSSFGVVGNSTLGGYGIYGQSFGGAGAGTAVRGEASGAGANMGVAGAGYTGVRGDGTMYGVAGVGQYGVAGNGTYQGISGYGPTAVYGSGSNYDFYAAGPGVDYGSNSSIRWKKNITELTGSLDTIMKLSGVSFDWDKEHGGKHAIGFIGEEIGKYYPEIVSFDASSTDPSYYVTGMDYSKMTPVLLEGIKELNNKVEELKTQNEGLKQLICQDHPSALVCQK